MVAALGRSGTSSCAGHCPADRRRARSSTRVRSPAAPCRPREQVAQQPLPRHRACLRRHRCPSFTPARGRAGCPRSRRMTKGGVREAPSRARWTRAATWADLRRVRGPRLPPDHPAPQDARRAQGRPQAADLRARHMDVRRGRLSAQGDEAALPDRRVQAHLPVGHGRSAAPAGPARVEPLDRPVPEPRRCEREFGRLKNEWALPPLRVHGLDRVRLHADLTILAKHACALSRARAVSLAA